MRCPIAAILCLLCLAGCASLGRAPAACVPEFPLTERWLGGDGVFSVPLGEGKTLWLFGDSFVTHKAGEGRKEAALVANSVALSECGGAGFEIAYHWRGGASPRAIFESGEEGVRYWPQAGFLIDNALFVFLLEVRITDAGNPLGFEITGTDLARVENPSAPPEDWRITLEPLVTGGELLPAQMLNTQLSVNWDAELSAGVVAIMLHKPSRGARRAFVATISSVLNQQQTKDLLARNDPLSAVLAGPPFVVAPLGPDGLFHEGLDPARAAILFEGAAPELSIVGDRGGHAWIVSMDGGFPSDMIIARALSTNAPLARSAGAPIALYLVPERDPENPEYRDNAFCYAGKAHGQYWQDDRVAVTYVCNAFDPEDLNEDLGLYRPRVVYLALPAAP